MIVVPHRPPTYRRPAPGRPVPIYSVLLDLPFQGSRRTTPIARSHCEQKDLSLSLPSLFSPICSLNAPPPSPTPASQPPGILDAESPSTGLDPLQSTLLADNMSNPTGIARTAPIAIASRKPPPHTSVDINPDGRDSIRHILSGSTGSTASTKSGSNTRTRRDRPCDACRRRKSRCVIHEGQNSCVLCQFHNQECTFVQSPQPRKRKLNAEGKEESLAKRRYAEHNTLAHVYTWTVFQRLRLSQPAKQLKLPTMA
jgi:hypothetical protein